MTREEILKDAMESKEEWMDFLIYEKGLNAYRILTNFAELQIKKREQEIVAALEGIMFEDANYGFQRLDYDDAIQIVKGE